MTLSIQLILGSYNLGGNLLLCEEHLARVVFAPRKAAERLIAKPRVDPAFLHRASTQDTGISFSNYANLLLTSIGWIITSSWRCFCLQGRGYGGKCWATPTFLSRSRVPVQNNLKIPPYTSTCYTSAC